MGTMTMGEQNTEAQAFELLDYCVARGVDWFDTAELYPVPPRAETANHTELLLGRWMRARGNRARVIITTKVAGAIPGVKRHFVTAGRFDPPLPLDDAPEPQLCREQILQACAASLRRLQTDYIDLYLIHWPSRYAPIFGSRRYRPEMERDAASFEEQVLAMGELIKVRQGAAGALLLLLLLCRWLDCCWCWCCCCAAAVLLLCCCCAAAVLLLCCCCAAAVLLLCCCCAAAVLPPLRCPQPALFCSTLRAPAASLLPQPQKQTANKTGGQDPPLGALQRDGVRRDDVLRDRQAPRRAAARRDPERRVPGAAHL